VAALPYAGSLLALLLLWLLVHALGHVIQRHRESNWVHKHVTVTPRPGPGATFNTGPFDDYGVDHGSDHILTVVGAEVRRSMTTEEESP
jgi:hypothetical protein